MLLFNCVKLCIFIVMFIYSYCYVYSVLYIVFIVPTGYPNIGFSVIFPKL